MRISSKHLIFEMDKNHSPVATCQSGDTVTFECCDCFSNTVLTSEDVVSKIDFSQVNPATGSLYIKDAKAGDILAVKIEKIEIGNQGAIVTAPGLGTLSDYIEQEETVICKVEGDIVRYFDYEIPLTKMIGVIGVAPAGEPVPTGVPHDHGGNMDTTLIKEGSTLYLPVNVDGALLSMGDCHAAMGDGEIMGSGIEVAADVTVTVEVIKDVSLPLPLVETETTISTLASRLTMEEASKLAIYNMATLITEKTDLSLQQAGMLLSAVGQLQVSQVVDPNVTMRMTLDKKYLKLDNNSLC